MRAYEKGGWIGREWLPVGAPAKPTGTRAFSTSTWMRGPSASALGLGMKGRLGVPPTPVLGSTRGYATATTVDVPEPTYSTKHKRLALIGARGFTGQALTSLLSNHPYLELTHVSSRQLAGYPLTGYTSPTTGKGIDYVNLSVEDVERMEKDGEVDAWVMALPNGACKVFVDAVERGASAKEGRGGVVVDLSADYRFEKDWVYGLPGEP